MQKADTIFTNNRLSKLNQDLLNKHLKENAGAASPDNYVLVLYNKKSTTYELKAQPALQ